MRWRGALTVTYAAAAAGLVPWAATLWWIQSRTGVIHHAALVTAALLCAVYVAALLAVGAATAQPHWAAIAASMGMTIAVTATCFHLLTTGSQAGGVWRSVGLAAVLVVILAASWLVDALTRRPRPDRVRLARWGLLTGLVLLSAPAVQLVRVTPALVPVSHLRIAWVGLDAAEVLGLSATAWCTWRRSRSGIVAGSVTAALLITDAVRNVVGTAGSERSQALAMTALEIPLAVGAISVAIAVSRRGG